MCNDRALRRGFTLPEVVIAIVVIGVGLTGVLLALRTAARSSADPLVTRQLKAVASTLMEEIQLKPFAAAANTAPAGCARDTFNDVADYNGVSSTGICSIDGTPIALLARYNMSISVTATAFGSIPASAAKRIVVTVTQGTQSLQMVGWRLDYAS